MPFQSRSFLASGQRIHRFDPAAASDFFGSVANSAARITGRAGGWRGPQSAFFGRKSN